MFEVTVNGSFAGAHNLKGYKGKCEKLHGHNWKVEVALSGNTLDKQGMLFDFVILKKYLNKAMEKLDHGYLNKIPPFNRINPSSENIAEYIFNKMKKQVKNKEVKVVKVSVWESENQKATYSNSKL